jgi:hypothetical protein
LELTTTYENQLNSLIIDRNRLEEEVEKDRSQISQMQTLLDSEMAARQD